jgi:hypothetical protein
MPLHVSTGLLIFAATSLIFGFMIAFGQESGADGRAPRGERTFRSALRVIADALFCWVSEDFRYPVAYPWLIFALAVVTAHFAPASWPGRVFQCDGDVYACLGVYDFRPHG